ncbi:hypothetical protein D3C75_1253160 [compost metagenome]
MTRKPRIMRILKGLTRVGTISTQMVSLRCRYCVIRIYEGTRPPLNSMVKKIKKVAYGPYAKLRREIT